MKLQYIFASGSLVESVDILCDNGGQLSGGFQLGKLQMCFIGFASRNIIFSL